MDLEAFAELHDTEVQVIRNLGGGPDERYKCTLTGTAVYMGRTATPVYGYNGSTNGSRRTYAKIIRGKRMVFHWQIQGQEMVTVPGDLKA